MHYLGAAPLKYGVISCPICYSVLFYLQEKFSDEENESSTSKPRSIMHVRVLAQNTMAFCVHWSAVHGVLACLYIVCMCWEWIDVV